LNPKQTYPQTNNRTRILDLFLALGGISLSSLFILTFFLGSYSNFNLAQSLSFYSSDGWCLGDKILFGPHCFGDFGLPLTQLAAGTDVWTHSPPSNYSALTNIIFKLFHQIYLSSGYDQTLVLYLISILFSYIYIVQDATKGLPSNKRILVMTLIGLSSPALLITLDRGNSVGFIALPLYLFLKSGMHGRNKSLLFWGILLVLMRPQFVLIILIFTFFKKWSLVMRFIVLTALTYILTFAIWDFDKTIINLKLFFFSLVRYSDIPIGILWPYNYSIANSITLAFNKFGLNNSELASNIVYVIIIMGIYSFVLSLSRKITEPNIQFLVTSCLVLPLCFLIPKTSYSYYATIPYVIFFAIIRSDEINKIKDMHILRSSRLYLLATAVTILPWLIPVSTSLGIGYLNLIQSFIGFFWLLFYLQIAVVGLLSLSKKNRRISIKHFSD
jgi:hypothetical protein